jgi:pyruvate/2-oxoglutarate dehydrogenase complex dihydrolipoamide acyltransferase (E2) component
MRASIVLPDFGAAPAKLSVWFVDPGDLVYEGDRVVEILVNGATFDVSAPATGRLVERLAHADQPLVPGQELGVLEDAEP